MPHRSILSPFAQHPEAQAERTQHPEPGGRSILSPFAQHPEAQAERTQHPEAQAEPTQHPEPVEGCGSRP
jgi:hypothetical protein